MLPYGKDDPIPLCAYGSCTHIVLPNETDCPCHESRLCACGFAWGHTGKHATPTTQRSCSADEPCFCGEVGELGGVEEYTTEKVKEVAMGETVIGSFFGVPVIKQHPTSETKDGTHEQCVMAWERGRTFGVFVGACGMLVFGSIVSFLWSI